MITSPLATGRFAHLRPPQPGPAAGPVDVLLIMAWMRATSTYGILADQAHFLESHRQAPGLRLDTIRANARKMGMESRRFTSPQGHTYSLFQAPNGDALAVRHLQKAAQIFPEPVGLTLRLDAIEKPQAQDLAQSLDALWQERAYGAVIARDPYNGWDAGKPRPIQPAWKPGLRHDTLLRHSQYRCALPLMGRMNQFHHMRENGAFGRHWVDVPMRHFSCVITYGQAVRLQGGHIGVSRPTVHIQTRDASPIPNLRTVLDRDHPFCTDMADRIAALPHARLPYAGSPNTAAMAKDGALGYVPILERDISSFSLGFPDTSTAHARIAAAKEWLACPKAAPDCPNFVPA